MLRDALLRNAPQHEDVEGPLRDSERRSSEPCGDAPSPHPLPASGARECEASLFDKVNLTRAGIARFVRLQLCRPSNASVLVEGTGSFLKWWAL
jgi:hypothetical protein